VQPNVTRRFARQGDILRSVPLIELAVADGRLHLNAGEGTFGPALLLSHDCIMAKRRGKPENRNPQIQRLQWLPLRDLGEQPVDKQRVARRGAEEPFELFYLGEVSGLDWEAYVVLSDLLSLPAELMEPTIEDVSGDPEADPEDPNHMVFNRYQETLAALDEAEKQHLYTKMSLFWSRYRPDFG
jgi:hypothetical protein